VFVDADADPRQQLESVTVQASLLASGGLEPGLVRKLVRRPALTRRYLAVEGHRALAQNEELLPLPVRSLIDLDVATRTDCPATSLVLAGRSDIADPPTGFGAIRARDLLAAQARTVQAGLPGDRHPRSRSGRLTDLDDALEDGLEDRDGVTDPFTSPVGGGGAIGKLLQRLMSGVRRLGGQGPPGADAPTHRSRRGVRGAAMMVSTAVSGSEAPDSASDASKGTKYREWDERRRRYREDWCTVREIEPPCTDGHPLPRPDVHTLRRPLTRLGIGRDRCHRQAQGDDIDVDAVVEARVGTVAGSTPDEAVYLDNLRRRRELAVLVLLDVSGSAAEAGTAGRTVHDQQRTAAAALTVALHQLGDRLALYTFRSQGRSAVDLLAVKRFDDKLDAVVMHRLGSLTPGAYSRLGAAIRHGTSVITQKAGTSRRLLVVLSDGLAYDHGYERVYGAADARRALAEARRQGVGCLCLSIGAATDNEELRRVFGSAAHASITNPARLADVVGPLFRAALRTADLRRRVSSEAKS